jgi:putative ABC transport system permease protein
MLLLDFAFQHLRRHWRLNTAALLGLTLAAALLASLPIYAAAISARELNQSLDAANHAERSLLLTGDRYTFNNDVDKRLRENLGALFKDRLEVRQSVLEADPLPPDSQIGDAPLAITSLRAYSFDKLSTMVRVLDGQFPDPIRLSDFDDPLRPPPVPAIIGAHAADAAGVKIGDRLMGSDGFHGYDLDIVGIAEPLDPQDDLWGGDLSPFELEVDAANPNQDAITLPLIVASGSMRTTSPITFRNIFPHEVLWRIVLNQRLVNPGNAAQVRSILMNIQTQLATEGATVSTGMIQIVADYLAQLSRVRMTLFLLSAQAFAFGLYTLGMLASFILDRSQIELATLSGRGASAWQIVWIFAVENLVLALPAALLLGPGLALAGMHLWGRAAGEMLPPGLPGEAWVLSGIATGLGWLALVLPVFSVARGHTLRWQQMRSRPPQLSTVQRFYLDLLLLGFAGLLWWQLNQSGSFVVRRLGTAQLADPLLLLGPTLLLIATAMLFLRLFPLLLRLVARLFQRLRGLTLPLGLHRLARDPLKPSRVVLLISLTVGLVLFTDIFQRSLTYSQTEMAHYLSGADLRVSLVPGDQQSDQPVPDVNDLTQELATLPGVRVISPVFRRAVRTEDGRTIQSVAVDPATFAQVARYPVGITQLRLPTVMNALQPGTEEVVAAVFSPSALPSQKGIGDESSLNFAGRRLSLGVHGIISNFPTLSGPFVLLSLPDLNAQMDLDALGAQKRGSWEAWLAVDPNQYENLVRHPALTGRILDGAQVRLRAMRSDAQAQGVAGALRLNALALALLSVAAFALVHYFAAQGRIKEFGVLRAMGLTAKQLLNLLITEGVLVTALGLVAGTIIGYGMARVMIPYLSQALSESLAGLTIESIIVDWPAIARLYLLLITLYGAALALLLLVLMRAGIHEALRVGDE